MNLPVSTVPHHEHTPTPELVKLVLADARELIALEVQLAVDDVRAELLKARRAAILGGVALLLGVLVIGTLLLALILAIGATAGNALLVAGGLLVAAALCAGYAYVSIPKKPLEKTRERLKDDVNRLKERVA